MLDVKFIRENLDLVEKSTKEKGYKVDVREVLELDDKRKAILTEVESLRTRRNEIAAKMKGGKPEQALIDEGKAIKTELSKKEEDLNAAEEKVRELLKKIPNVIFEDVPLGGEECSVEVKKWGKNHEKGVDHLDFATNRDWLDFERGAKVAGAKFYYLKGDLALLENALLQYGLSKVLEHGFTFMTVPDMVSSRVLEGCGFNPRSSEQSDEYYIEGEDLALIATAEMPLTGYHMDEIIDEDKLPLFYAGYSPCFRKEVGAHGLEERGVYRIHQFEKQEMVVICRPDQSKRYFSEMLKNTVDFFRSIEIPVRTLECCSGDLADLKTKSVDVEAWSPRQKKYFEVGSCSNLGDAQARRLKIRVRSKEKNYFAHTLNNTVVAPPRMLIAFLENNYTSNQTVKIPKPLQIYMGNKTELK